MCHCIGQNSYMGHSSLHLHCGSVMVELAQVELCGKHLEEPHSWIYKGLCGFLATLDGVWVECRLDFGALTRGLMWFVDQKDGLLLAGSSGIPCSTCGLRLFVKMPQQLRNTWLQALLFSYYYGCLVHDLLTWRRLSGDKLEENHRSVKQEASDNEALYSKPAVSHFSAIPPIFPYSGSFIKSCIVS